MGCDALCGTYGQNTSIIRISDDNKQWSVIEHFCGDIKQEKRESTFKSGQWPNPFYSRYICFEENIHDEALHFPTFNHPR